MPVEVATTLSCCGRRRAAELHCLRLRREYTPLLWELQGFIACGYGDYTAHAAVGDAGLLGFIACDCDDYTALL